MYLYIFILIIIIIFIHISILYLFTLLKPSIRDDGSDITLYSDTDTEITICSDDY